MPNELIPKQKIITAAIHEILETGRLVYLPCYPASYDLLAYDPGTRDYDKLIVSEVHDECKACTDAAVIQ